MKVTQESIRLVPIAAYTMYDCTKWALFAGII